MGVFKGYQPNIFRAVSGSLFSTAANWSRGYVPTGSDVATIADNCVIDVSRTIGTLIVRAPFTASVNSGLTLNVSQSFLVKGHISFSAGGNVFLSGKYNEINGISPGTSRFIYKGVTDQLLPGGPYYDLETSYYDGVLGVGYISNKKTTSNLVINRGLQINYGTLELGKYDYYCSGSTQINGGLYGTLSKNQPGNIVFNGVLKNTAAGYPLNFINFSNGNPTIEVRNGIDLYQYNTVNTGKGTWRFTTNNQNIYNTAGAVSITFDAPVSIENVALSVLANASIVKLNDVINGTTTTSQLVNSGSIYFNSVASLNSMTTGTFDYTSSNNTIGFTGDYSANIPSRFNVFRNVVISGTGIKTLATSSYLSGSLTITTSGGSLELSGSNLTVSGSTSIIQTCNLTKSRPGNVTFIGPLTISTNSPSTPNIDFSLGNPNVEVRNGMNGGGFTFLLNTGTGSWNFTTNTQSIDFSYCGDSPKFRAPITISGIPLTIVGVASGRAIYTFYNTIDGTNANSRLVNTGYMRFMSASIVNPMSTFGTFEYTASALSTIDYYFDGDFAIPYSQYFGLALGGTGSKYLTKDLTVTSLSASSGSTTFNFGDYNFTNLGPTITLSDANVIYLRKTGSGSLLFSGSVSQYINFSGSSGTTEFKAGLTNNSNPSFFTGTGSWIFSTNNQELSVIYSGAKDFDCSITVSGSITLSIPAGGPGVVTHNFRGPINGTTANSKFLMNANSGLNYFNSTAPMIVGILDATSSLGTTFSYASGSQDIKGGTYRNLTMLSGIKTLQGNVSVLNTLNTGSGATLATINLNGFTLTNP